MSRQALKGWCKLIAQFLEGLLPYSEVLQLLVIIPGFQDNVVLPHQAGSPGPEIAVHPRAYNCNPGTLNTSVP